MQILGIAQHCCVPAESQHNAGVAGQRVNNSSNTTTPEGDRLAEGAAVLSLNDPYGNAWHR